MPGHLADQQGRHRPRRAGRLRVACAGALLTAVLATPCWGYQDSRAIGLAGILPFDVPAGLTADDFIILGPNWERWGQETSETIDALYAQEYADLAEQRATLARLRAKLETIDEALGDPLHKEIHSQLTGLRGRLARRVDLADALLATISEDPQVGRTRRLGSANARLASAMDALRADLKTVPRGSAWLTYVRADQLTAAAAGNDTSDDTLKTLTSVQRKIDERDSLADSSQREFLGRVSFLELSGAIGDVRAAIAWQPAADQVAIVRTHAAQLVAAIETYEVAGDDAAAAEVNAAYQAIKAAASNGGDRISTVMRQHYFSHNIRLIASEGFCRKTVTDNRIEQGYLSVPASQDWVFGVDLHPSDEAVKFDLRITGTVNTTGPKAAQANPDAGTTETFVALRPVLFDGRSINIGPVSVDTNAKPVVDELSRDVYTETDSRYKAVSTENLDKAVFFPLQELGWYPDSIQTYSTSDELIFRARLMDPGEMGAAAPAVNPTLPRNGLAIQVHESAFANALDRLELAGKIVTDEELRALLEQRISKLLGREFHLPAEDIATREDATEEDVAAAGNKYVFDTHDPLRVQVDNGAITITMRIGLVREGKDPVPLHIIEVPLGVSVREDRILLSRQGNVRVNAAPGTPRSLPRLNIIRAKVQRALPDLMLGSSINLQQPGQTITFKVTSIDAQDGWITVLAK